MEEPRFRIVVFDVDGVIFHDHLILCVARRLGLRLYLRGLWDSLRFDRGQLSLVEFLGHAHRILAGQSQELLWSVYRAMKLSRHAREAVAELRRNGHVVILVSAGVPDFMVDHLARRLGADEAGGVQLPVEGRHFTGEVHGELASSNGKVEFVDRYLALAGLTWDDVAVVGDDANNIPLMERAALSIGYKSTWAVRQKADILVDDLDLLQVSRVVRHSSEYRVDPEAERHRPVALPPWYIEIRRKIIHASAAALPFVAPFFGWQRKWILSALMIVLSGMYMLSEYFRLNGLHFPIFYPVTRWVLRASEQRRFAFAPVTLAAGVALVLQIFPSSIAYPCIMIAALGDSFGALIGERWGRIPLPHNPDKTLEGSLAFMAVSFACASRFLPAGPSVTAALVATVVESLNIRDFDNLFVPLLAGLAVRLTGFTGM